MNTNKLNKKQMLIDTYHEAVTDSHSKALIISSKLSTLSNKAKALYVTMAASLYFAVATGYTYAAKGNGCNSQAANSLVNFIGNAAKFMIAIGGALALLMFAVAAFFIITGHKADQVNKGFKMVKNALIGLGILALGVLIKSVLLDFLKGVTGSGADNCINKGGGSGLG